MNLGYAIATFPNEVEWWARLEVEELQKRGINPYIWTFRGEHSDMDFQKIKQLDFAIYHFAQVAYKWRRLPVQFCCFPHANDIFTDNGRTLKKVSEHPNCKFIGYQSLYHKKKFEEWGIDKPLVYIPMSCRTDLFKRTKPLGNKIVAGGRLIPKKGLERVVNSLDDVVIFGDGELKEDLRKINPTCQFTGWLTGEELRDLFEDCWLFLSPSIIDRYGDSDGIPNTIKEAMLMRLQVLASPVAGIPDLDNIYTTEHWDSQSLANIITQIDKTPNYSGEKEIRNIYSPVKCVDRILNTINQYV